MPCNADLDPHGDHAVSCEKGPWRVGRHDEIADTLVGYCRGAGASTVREFPFKELQKGAEEAVLDLWATGSAWMADRIIDVTVRHPCAPSYVEEVAATDGACAAEAERSKQRRYPPAGGTVVTTFAVETFGRLRAEAEGLLAEASLAVRRRNLARGHPAGKPLQRWRATLSALIAKAVARAIRSAQPGCQL